MRSVLSLSVAILVVGMAFMLTGSAANAYTTFKPSQEPSKFFLEEEDIPNDYTKGYVMPGDLPLPYPPYYHPED